MEQCYHGVVQSCLARAEGDQQQADYLANCTYFEYYYRILNYNEWLDKRNEAIKNANKA